MQHGGNIDLIINKYNLSRDNIIDFSGNMNPLGAPEIKIDIKKSLETYPDPGYKNLRKAISDYVNLDLKNITVGNGSSELISLLFKAILPKRTLIVAPTYSEYEREAKFVKSKIIYYITRYENNFNIKLEDLFKTIFDYKINFLVLCNPNNPTGNYISNNLLDNIINYCEMKNIFVFIDESYAEFFGKTAVKFINKYENMIIVRGTSKFFCLPGLRLGYLLTSNHKLIKKINNIKNPWSVNSIANQIGKIIFRDRKYILKSKKYIKTEYFFIKQEIKKINSIKLYDSEANFFLCEILNDKAVGDLFFYLLKNNLVIRDLTDIKFLCNKFFRFAINTHQNNLLLINHLKKFFA